MQQMEVRVLSGVPRLPAIVQLDRARPSEGRDSGSTPDGWTKFHELPGTAMSGDVAAGAIDSPTTHEWILQW